MDEAVTREWGLRIFCGLIGAAFGAAAQGVSWTWWACWAVAVATWMLVASWHRGNGHAHA
jgi:hypothetical protein